MGASIGIGGSRIDFSGSWHLIASFSGCWEEIVDSKWEWISFSDIHCHWSGHSSKKEDQMATTMTTMDDNIQQCPFPHPCILCYLWCSFYSLTCSSCWSIYFQWCSKYPLTYSLILESVWNSQKLYREWTWDSTWNPQEFYIPTISADSKWKSEIPLESAGIYRNSWGSIKYCNFWFCELWDVFNRKPYVSSFLLSRSQFILGYAM